MSGAPYIDIKYLQFGRGQITTKMAFCVILLLNKTIMSGVQLTHAEIEACMYK